MIGLFCRMFGIVFLIISSFTALLLYHILVRFVFNQLPCSLRQMLDDINLIGFESSEDFSYLDDVGGNTHTINFLRDMRITKITQRDRLRGIRESLRCVKNLSATPLNERWFLFGGSLLGWTRHRNFLPNDVDADVMFLRDDYEQWLSHLTQLKGRLDYRPDFMDVNQSKSFNHALVKDLLLYVDKTCLVTLREKELKEHKSLVAEVVNVGTGFKTDVWLAEFDKGDTRNVLWHEFGREHFVNESDVFPLQTMQFGRDWVNVPRRPDRILLSEFGARYTHPRYVELTFMTRTHDTRLFVALLAVHIVVTLVALASVLYASWRASSSMSFCALASFIALYCATASHIVARADCVAVSCVGTWLLAFAAVCCLRLLRRQSGSPSYFALALAAPVPRHLTSLCYASAIGCALYALATMRGWLALLLDNALESHVLHNAIGLHQLDLSDMLD